MLDLLVLILAMILNPRAKRRRRRAVEAKEKEALADVDAEAAVHSSSERQSNDTIIRQRPGEQSIREQEGHSHSTHSHHHIGRVVSKEEGEMRYSIDPVSAAINDTGEKAMHEKHRFESKEIV